jgi:pimeloyl-ACP methyl ester carboxylesterase
MALAQPGVCRQGFSMVTHPAQLFTLLLLGIISLGFLAGALYLLWKAFKPRVQYTERVDPADVRGTLVATRRERPGKRLMIAAALTMLVFVFAGRYVVGLFHEGGDDQPELHPVSASKIRGASGAELAVQAYGRPSSPTLVLTHGWGADSRSLKYAVNDLADQFHVIVWDLPGLGASTPMIGEYSLARFADDLDSIVQSTGSQHVILAGHSIGGMINLEYARRHAEKIGKQVGAIVQINTTFTNPVETKKSAERSRRLQEPVFEPLLHVISWISPVARGLGWLAYQSGLAHLQLASSSFAGTETRQQLDLMARYAYRSSPRVIARGTLAMLDWDASDVLPTIKVPVLILSGSEDVTTLPSASDRMAREIPKARHVSVTPAAHMGPVEQHQRYARAIAAFVNDRDVARELAVR